MALFNSIGVSNVFSDLFFDSRSEFGGHIVSLTNGNYAIIAQSFSGGAGGQFDIFARVFDGDTHAEVGSLSTIESSNTSATIGDVEAFNDGFIVAANLFGAATQFTTVSNFNNIQDTQTQYNVLSDIDITVRDNRAYTLHSIEYSSTDYDVYRQRLDFQSDGDIESIGQNSFIPNSDLLAVTLSGIDHRSVATAISDSGRWYNFYATNETGSNDLSLSRYSSNGDFEGTTPIDTSSIDYSFTNLHAVALANNNALIVYNENVSSASNDWRARHAIVDPEGNVVERLDLTVGSSDNFVDDIVIFDNGAIGVILRADPGATVGGDEIVRIVLFDGNGAFYDRMTLFSRPRTELVAEVQATAVGSGDAEQLILTYGLDDGDQHREIFSVDTTFNNVEFFLGTVLDDTIIGRNSADLEDLLSGRWGNDEISGRDGIDFIAGGAGVDILDGGAGDDQLFGGAGNDLLIGGVGADILDGGEGNDFASYYNSAARVSIRLDTNVFSEGDAQGDTLVDIEDVWGSQFDDYLSGDSGDNQLSGYGGNDYLRGNEGADRLDGGSGTDLVSYFNSNARVSIRLDTKVFSGGHAQGDRLINIEDVGGTDYDDYLAGDSGNNRLYGNAGNDYLRGNEGADRLDGGAGMDFVSYYNSDARVVVRLDTNVISGGDATGDTLISIEEVGGSAYNDYLAGTSGNNELYGYGGNDYLRGNDGGDLLDGGGGIDFVSYYNSDARVSLRLHTNSFSGGHADGDTLVSIEDVGGSQYGDYISGTGGSNTIYGYGGDDYLRGIGGDDRLDGGVGNDLLQGGSGNDTFVFKENYGEDTIDDFAPGTDMIELEVNGVNNFGDLNLQTSGSDVRIDFGGGDVLVISNTTVAALDSDDFSFV